MKKLILLLLTVTLCSTLYLKAQQVKIISFQVKNILPAKVDDWGNVPAALILTAQKSPAAQLKEPKLIIQIKSNGAIICGNNLSTAVPLGSFDIKTFTTQELSGMLSNCPVLKDGSYQICVQFFSLDRVAISNEVCKEFRVETPKEVDFAPPALVTPENDKKFSALDLLKPVMFRWTPVVPKPKEPVTYRLKVWQLMQGQNGLQAMRANQPIVTKDVENITQAVISNLYTGPCKPPYLCDYIWSVQAVNKDGKPVGRNEGNSEPYAFKMAADNINTKIDSVDIGCCVNNKQNIFIKISNLHPTNSAQVTSIKYRVNGTGPLTNLTPTVPVLPNMIGANSSQIFTAAINCVDSMKTIKFIVDAIWPTDPDNINNETALDTLHCACDPCKTMGVALQQDNLSITASSSGQILLSGVLTGLNPATIKKITMELVYFNIEQTGDSNCVKCADNREWGNFIKPASSYFPGYNPGLLNGVNFGREWTWLTKLQKECGSIGDQGGGTGNGNNGGGGMPKCATCGTGPVTNPENADAKIANTGPVIIIDPNPNPKLNSFSLPIAVPPGSSLKCCGDKIKICIRYTVWDFCCHACDIIKCYEIERRVQ